MAQQVKYPVLSLQWLGSLLWCRFNPWPRKFLMHGCAEKERERELKIILKNMLAAVPIVARGK